jgi:hypothetical protein
MPLLPRRGHGADDAHALVRAGEEATAPGRGAGSSDEGWEHSLHTDEGWEHSIHTDEGWEHSIHTDEGWEHSIFLLQSVWEPQWQVASEKEDILGGLVTPRIHSGAHHLPKTRTAGS